MIMVLFVLLVILLISGMLLLELVNNVKMVKFIIQVPKLVKVVHYRLQFNEMEFVFHVHIDHSIYLIKESVTLVQMVQYLISHQIHVLVHNLCKQIKQISYIFINVQTKQYIQTLQIHAFVQIIFHSTMVKIVQHAQ